MRIGLVFVFVAMVWVGGVCCAAAGGSRAGVDVGGDWGLHEEFKGCSDCHGKGAEEITAETAELVAAVPQLCYECHEEYAAIDTWKHGPAATGECLLCHEPHQAANKGLLSKPVPELCRHCHEGKTLDLVPDHAEESYANCGDCHEAHSSPGRMLLKQAFLASEQGKAYMSKSAAARPRPTFVDGRGSLGGIEGVNIVLSLNGSKSLERYGVKAEFITAGVEKHLSRNGVTVLSDKEHNERDSTLHVQVRLMEVPSMRRPGQVDAISGSIDIYLQQAVELLGKDRDGRTRFCKATTWDTGAIAIWGVTQVRDGFDEAIKILVDRFGKDYLAANPPDSTPTSTTQVRLQQE